MNMRLIGVAALAAFAAATSVATAATTATTATSVPLSGTQTVLDEKKGNYQMHGSLLGSWHVTSFVSRYRFAHPFVSTGTERFVGCLDVDRSSSCDVGEPTGTLNLAFVSWADYDAIALVRGQCVHPIVGGSGVFAGASGVLFTNDCVVGKAVRTTYQGVLHAGSAPA